MTEKKRGLVTRLKPGETFTCNVTGREVTNESKDTIKIRISKPKGMIATITEKKDDRINV